MKRNVMKSAAATGLVSLSVLAGSMAFAATDGSAKDAAEMQTFLASNPAHAKMVSTVEAKTGGKVVSAEVFTKDGKLIEFSDAMANGNEQEVILNTADGSIMDVITQAENEENHDDSGENDNDDELSNN